MKHQISSNDTKDEIDSSCCTGVNSDANQNWKIVEKFFPEVFSGTKF